MSAAATTPLRHLFPGWFATVMGLAGLSLAFHRAAPLMGDLAGAAGLVLGGLALVVFLALAAASVLRRRRYPDAWAEDCRHPVRHTFIAALPVAVILLATVAVAHGLHETGWRAAVAAWWWVGSGAQLAVTWWVLARWWRGAAAGGLSWAAATPALFVPIVGNVLVPLAGVPLGQTLWSAAQFGVGLMFWPVVLVLLVTRLAVQGPWPDKLLPTSFIFIAPPAVIGLSALQLGAPSLVGWALWGMAAFTMLWVAPLARRVAAIPFGMPHWGMSFPLAAMAALSLRLATDGTSPAQPMRALAIALLALASLVIAALALATLRGLRDGTLLTPEPAAPVLAAAP